MSEYRVKLPDVGEGIAEAELVKWLVSVGDRITEETPLAEVLTDKATVEIFSPVVGVVKFLLGDPGDQLAVGSDFAGIEIEEMSKTNSGPDDGSVVMDERDHADDLTTERLHDDSAPFSQARRGSRSTPAVSAEPRISTTHPLASPAVRARAQRLNINLDAIAGTGPSGRVVHADLDGWIICQHPSSDVGAERTAGGVHVESIRGLRRRIAERLSQASNEIPHITYVDQVDATELEKLRTVLNSRAAPASPRLTLLPFVVRSIAIACRDQPRLNAHYDTESQKLLVFDDVNVGIATQTTQGLLVPVVRNAARLSLIDTASEIEKLAASARNGNATREDLSHSTITITSLGAMGGLVTTPIINHPEVAIVGVNKMEIRPVWRDGSFVPRSIFNLSCSFDHRIIDGWDAAVFVQRLKELLEVPALLFAGAES